MKKDRMTKFAIAYLILLIICSIVGFVFFLFYGMTADNPDINPIISIIGPGAIILAIILGLSATIYCTFIYPIMKKKEN